MWCKDPFLVYLKQFGYNAIRLPKADVRPLQLLAKDGKEFNRLGEIHNLLVAGNSVHSRNSLKTPRQRAFPDRGRVI